MSERAGIRISLLGPLLVNGRRWTGARSERWRIILAVLAVNVGVIVSYETLIRALWGDNAPADPVKALQSCVERLQARIGVDGPRILNQAGIGYSVDVTAREVDIPVFTDLCTQGRTLAGSGQWEGVIDVLRKALALRRSTPFIDASSPALETKLSPSLDILWIQALLDQARAYLHLGRHEDILSRLEQLTWEHPTEEIFWALLMLAQYRSHRRRAALATYEHACAALKREINAGPDEILKHMYEQIRSRVSPNDIPVP